jgi:polyvinyl alcohol dehydrogenase (cytochrome)
MPGLQSIRAKSRLFFSRVCRSLPKTLRRDRTLTSLLVAMVAVQPVFAATVDGKEIYRQRCSGCHTDSGARTPTREQLGDRTPEEIIHALTSGVMRGQAAGLEANEIRAVAEFISAKQHADTPLKASAKSSNDCATVAAMTPGPDDWNGWGRSIENSRYQPQPKLGATDVPRLELKWAFAYPKVGVRGQPTVVGGRVFVASTSGQVYALDARTGCTYWTYELKGNVRGAIAVGRYPANSNAEYVAYFGDDQAVVHAVNAFSGAPLWTVKVDDFPAAIISGSLFFYRGRVYVPVSSREETLAGFLPNYQCCKFRGSVVALDAASGKTLWKQYAIEDEPKPFKKNAQGGDMFGPAGASVWSAPTIDAKRNLLYVGTGNSYTDVETKASNAIVALDLDSGQIKWVSQQVAQDNYVMNCTNPGKGNCPETLGDDYDFGASPILQTLPDGKRIILAGQKSGILYALNPDRKGELVWKVKLSPGGYLGGIQWGPAADDEQVYVAISDVTAGKDGTPGLYAVRVTDGRKIWATPAPTPQCSWGVAGCSHAQSQAVTVIPGVVFSGSIDGHLRAYSTKDGSIIWDFDTARTYEAVNGMVANGGSLDTGGPTLVDGMLYVNSGYRLLAGHAGNVLLAFFVPR